MKRFAPSIASSFDFSSKTAYPPTTSLASVKGPSTVVTCPRERRTRVLAAVGESPPLSRIVPALTASSLSFAIASISSLGGAPLFSADLTSIMNRIVISPLSLGSETNFLASRQFESGSTYSTHNCPQNRPLDSNFLTTKIACKTPQLGRRRGLLHARVLFKDLPQFALTLANDFEEIFR